jgi:TM2 domain-containing membrane protein YozV
MAAIASMELPEFVNKRVSMGIALGLLIVAFLTIPVLSALFIGLISAITDAGSVNSFFRWMVEAAGYVFGLGKDITHELRSLASDSPAIPALLSTLIPMVMLWAWLLWYLLGGPKFLAKR